MPKKKEAKEVLVEDGMPWVRVGKKGRRIATLQECALWIEELDERLEDARDYFDPEADYYTSQ